MLRFDRNVVLSTATCALVLLVSDCNVTTRSPSAHTNRTVKDSADYMLDDSVGNIALYSGAAYRGYVREEDQVFSLEVLQQRVALVPRGSKLHYTPYRRDSSGQPLLFENGRFLEFERFCRIHGIELIVPGSH